MNKEKGQGKIDKDNEGDTRTVKYTKNSEWETMTIKRETRTGKERIVQ